jgi:hypothetical protein
MLSSHWAKELFGVLLDNLGVIIPNFDIAFKVLDESFVLGGGIL